MSPSGLDEVEDVAPHRRSNVNGSHRVHQVPELIRRHRGTDMAHRVGRIGSRQHGVHLGPTRVAEHQPDLMLGYPSRPQMDAMLAGPDPADTVRHVRPSVTPDEFRDLMDAVTTVHVAPPVRSYILDLVESTRAHPLVAVCASPRAALALIRVSSALAVASGRSFVTPDDVQEAAVPSLAHRLLLHTGVEVTGGEGEALVAEVAASIPVPLRGD